MSQLFRSQSDKLIVSPNNEQPRLLQDGRQEVVLRQKFCSEFARGINGWIDVSPESLLSVGLGADHILEGRVPHDEQVDVACRPQFAPGGGSKHEGDNNALS